MIRLLTTADHDICMALVQQQPAENLFIIGDIEAFGYDQPFQKIWGQFEGEELIAVLLKYESNYIPYAQGAFDVQGFAAIINSDDEMTELSGLKHLTDLLEPYIHKELFKKQELYYAKCTELQKFMRSKSYNMLNSLHATKLRKILHYYRPFLSSKAAPLQLRESYAY